MQYKGIREVGSDVISVSVIIPCFQQIDLLSKVVCELDKNAFPDFEILLVSDGCNETEYLASQLHTRHECRVLNTGHSAGFGVSIARNLGASRAVGTQLLFLDSDSIPTPRHVAEYWRAYNKNTLLIGPIRHVDEHDHSRVVIDEFRPPFVETDFCGSAIEAASFCWTANIGVPRESFYEIGGFDMAFLNVGGADSDFGERFTRYFGMVEYVDAPVSHCGISSGLRRFVVEGEFQKRRFLDWLGESRRVGITNRDNPSFGAGVEDRTLYDAYRKSGRYDSTRSKLVANGGREFFRDL